ncbi:MAG: hypothetical protein FJ095_09560 [Deltaproteobacteria bacterium]|nr:hypothetical protein [Deltaproteobacteria bacterium]
MHLAYLLALPVMGLPALYHARTLGPVLVTAWLPVVVYVLFLVKGYRLNAKPIRALLVTLAVPGQLGVLTWLADGDLPQFFYESAVVEVGTLVSALFVAMAIARPSGVWGAALIGLLPLAWLPYARPLFASFRDWPLSGKALFITSVGSAFFGTVRVVRDAGDRFNRTKEEQTVLLEHGSDGISGVTVKPLTGQTGELRRFVFFVLALAVVGVGFALLAVNAETE